MTPWHTHPDRHTNVRFWIIMGYLTVVAILCAAGLWKVQQQQEKLHDQSVLFASKICMSSNGARHALVDLLTSAQSRTQTAYDSGQITKKQESDSLDFYNDLKSKIHFTECPKP